MESKTASWHNRSRRDRQVRAALVDLRAALNALYGQDAPAAILYGSHRVEKPMMHRTWISCWRTRVLSSADRRSGT